jgi:hypothetical protein
MAFNGQNLQSTIAATSATFGAVSSAVGTAQRLGSALSSIGSASDVGSAIRSINLPAAGEAVGDIMGAISSFGGGGNNPNDWRVKLSLPSWVSFKNSPVLKPLKDAGGFIFPYTPEITIASSAKYTASSPTHSNYPFQIYQNSEPGNIVITGDFNVEDSSQALYWIACVHYLRSATKMFTGSDPKAGNPPPIVKLNGYGAYVFKNVPVVISAMKITLGKECDYISCDVVGSAAGEIAGIADSIGGLADAVGGALPGLSGITSTVSSIAGGVGQVASLLGSFGLGGSTGGGKAHVPTKSSITVTLTPVYSRASARKFSLDRFVQGGYMNNSVGYV